ncbi:hypothetical protein B2J88_52575, partial [Rhodococcus sp. SRB_17]|nr:hypothetical protein [Rhodococcus sp. SRB_17]
APDTFWVPEGGSSIQRQIWVNLRETWQDDVTFPLMTYDVTPLMFVRGPLVQLPGGGPSVGVVLVTDGTGATSS